jgi:hypothetical protein
MSPFEDSAADKRDYGKKYIKQQENLVLVA